MNGVKSNVTYPVIEKSQALLARAKKRIPACSQTLAKGPSQYVQGVAPNFLEKGLGARVWDVDGNEYLDYNMGIGPISLGYAYPKVDDAIRAQLKKGITFSLVSPLEVEVAELISEVIPNAESVRFSKTGCDVTTAALRVARAFTKRKNVAVCGYHGWHDWYIGVTSRDAGIPEETKAMTKTFAFNDIESAARVINQGTAAVILEPMLFDLPKDNFLRQLKALCEKNGALLIFDEMWTGFRVAIGGAQEYFDVKPDLAVYSKACANGMPIAFLTGRADVMELFNKEVFSYTTFGGETLSLAACKATINELIKHNVPKYLDEKGALLKDGYNNIAKKHGVDKYTKCFGYNCRSMVIFTPEAGNGLEVKTFMQQEMIKRGILWAGFHNMCFSHNDEDIAYTLSVYEEVLPLLKQAIESNTVAEKLRGKVLEAVFRKTTSYNIKPKLQMA